MPKTEIFRLYPVSRVVCESSGLSRGSIDRHFRGRRPFGQHCHEGASLSGAQGSLTGLTISRRLSEVTKNTRVVGRLGQPA
jgi:hypothetical protein